jgi:hypothetical protein
MITDIFKPNSTLGNLVGEPIALSRDFVKDDHVIVVGGPALIGTQINKIENGIDNIAKNCTHQCWFSGPSRVSQQASYEQVGEECEYET